MREEMLMFIDRCATLEPARVKKRNGDDLRADRLKERWPWSWRRHAPLEKLQGCACMS